MKAPIKPTNEKFRLRDLTISETPIEKNFERITRITKALFNVPIAAISLVDQEKEWFKSLQGLDVYETSRAVSFFGHTLLQDEIFLINDTMLDHRFSENPLVKENPEIRFYAGFPIMSKNGYKIGALCIIDNKPRDYTPDDLGPLKDLAALVQEELLNRKRNVVQSELIQELDESERKSLTDLLTGVWNRGGIDAVLFKKLTVSHGKNFGLVLMDIDNFKYINDTYGHSAGDRVLIEVSNFCLKSLRDSDAFGRWGGDEFLMIIDVTEKKKILEIVGRLIKKIADSQITYKRQHIPVSVTAGVILVNPTKNQSRSDLIDLADKGLYEGKNSGKNKIVFIDD